MLDVQSVTRHYGEVKAVDDVTFSVDRGEVVGLLGHNGAGKTTIMKMLAGYLEPDSGSIHFDGRDVAEDARALQARLGYLPEVLPVYPELEVADYLDYAADLRGLAGAAKRDAMRRAIEATDLGDRLFVPIGTLSRGYRQRVGVAQAILGEPDLVILDEPTNGLDPAQTEDMRALIRRLGEGATVLLSTHVMQEVEAVCDRVLIVRSGRLAVDTALESRDGEELRVRVGADLSQVRALLDDIDGIEAVIRDERVDIRHAEGTTDSPPSEIRLVIANDRAIDAIAAEVTQRLVHAEVPVHAVYPRRRDLQQLFMSVAADPDKSVSAVESTERAHGV